MYSTKGLKSPLGGCFEHLSPISFLNISHTHLFISRANEGFKRSIYAGIPSLDLSYPPGYF
ncbi:hypothetical protein B9T16_26765 [Arthrospira sp. PCC 8006]